MRGGGRVMIWVGFATVELCSNEKGAKKGKIRDLHDQQIHTTQFISN